MAILDNWFNNQENFAQYFWVNSYEYSCEREHFIMFAFTGDEKKEVELNVDINKFYDLERDSSSTGLWLKCQGYDKVSWTFISPLAIMGSKLVFKFNNGQEYIYEYSDVIPEINLKRISKVNEFFGNALAIAYNSNSKYISFFRVNIPDREYDEHVQKICSRMNEYAKRIREQYKKQEEIKEAQIRAELLNAVRRTKPEKKKEKPPIIEEVSWKDREIWMQEMHRKQTVGMAVKLAKKEILEVCKRYANEIAEVKDPIVNRVRNLVSSYEIEVESDFFEFREKEAEKLELLNDEISTAPYRFLNPYHPMGKRGDSHYSEEDIEAALSEEGLNLDKIASIMETKYEDFVEDDFSDMDIDEILKYDHYGQL